MAAFRVLTLLALLVVSCDAFAGAGAAAPKKKIAKKPVKKVVKKPVARKVAPKKRVVVRKSGFSPESDIGVTPPLGLFDPLGFLNRGPEVYRRSQEMEIKHGRFSMAACLGVIVTEAGVRLPGYISYDQDLKFSDVPGTLDGAYFGIPLAGWVQIVMFIAALDIAVFAQKPENEPGNTAADLEWVRYDNADVKAFKLNAERNNGRAAMFGILGMISHTALGEDALFPLVS